MNGKVKYLVGVGMLTAIVVVLQAVCASIPVGIFNITLCLVPIIVGAALFGVLSGAWLGFVFGLVVLLTNAQAFLEISVPGTVMTCLSKGAFAGAVAALVYSGILKIDALKKNELLAKNRQLIAVICAGIAAPVVNTGVFLIGCRLFFFDTIKGWAAAAGIESAGTYMLTAFVGMNFVVELAVNLVLASVIVYIIKLVKKNYINN